MAEALTGKVAVITGSSRGIGKGIALELAREGATVVLTGRVEAPIEGRAGWSLAEAVEAVQALGGRALAVRMDVTSDDDLKRLVDTTMTELGRIDILVNNAARMGGGGPFLGGDPGLIDEFLTTNIRAPYLLSQLAAPHMAAGGGGTIVNITSGAGRMPAPPSPGQAPRGESSVGVGYGITKAALNRWVAGVAGELMAHNIAIVSVDPGLTVTERNQLNPRPGVDYSRAEPAPSHGPRHRSHLPRPHDLHRPRHRRPRALQRARPRRHHPGLTTSRQAPLLPAGGGA
jgi:NAD(P)-dependent dehydrogenase (short-subunit alcohol dehydrogenase family)